MCVHARGFLLSTVSHLSLPRAIMFSSALGSRNKRLLISTEESETLCGVVRYVTSGEEHSLADGSSLSALLRRIGASAREDDPVAPHNEKEGNRQQDPTSAPRSRFLSVKYPRVNQ